MSVDKTAQVSVVLVAYNDAELLRKNLPGVRNIMEQSGYVFEIVGVDNGSRDDTRNVLSEYCDKVLTRRQNEFYVPAFNDGLRACAGEFIFVTCPDITWTPDVVKLIEYSATHRDVLVAPFYYYPDGSPQFIIHNRRIDLTRVFFQMTPFGYFLDEHLANFGIHRRNQYRDFRPCEPFAVDWTGAMFVVSSKILSQLRGADDSMPLCYHDADLCDRLRRVGGKCVVVPDAVVSHKWRATTRNDPRTSAQAAHDFRAYVRKRWRLRRLVLWPLILMGVVFSVPLVPIVQRRRPDRNLVALRVG